jgi:hypothetical protein
MGKVDTIWHLASIGFHPMDGLMVAVPHSSMLQQLKRERTGAVLDALVHTFFCFFVKEC